MPRVPVILTVFAEQMLRAGLVRQLRAYAARQAAAGPLAAPNHAVAQSPQAPLQAPPLSASRPARRPSAFWLPPAQPTSPPSAPPPPIPANNTEQDTDIGSGGGASTAAVEPPPVETKTRPQPTKSPQREAPKQWHVVLLDSDQHTYEYVIEMMMKVFRHPVEKAFEIARAVDKQGRAICATTHRELAELRVEQVRGFGIDPRIAQCKTAMRCYLEPSE
ncbi:MAG: ATP-dependent Clp protease adaptor ClpS [Phycisphaerales bacterium]